MLHLLYSSCIPVLTYAGAVKEYPSRQMQDCCTAMNDALRFLFGYNRWDSVRSLRESFGYKSLVELFHGAKTKFDASLYAHVNRDVGQGHAGHAMPCPVVGILKLSGHQSLQEKKSEKRGKRRKKKKKREKKKKKKKK